MIIIRVGTRCWAWILALIFTTAAAAHGAELDPPADVSAGNGFAIVSHGRGPATFYLIGPSHVAKRQVELGTSIPVAPTEVRTAGRYLAIACDSGGCTSAAFDVRAGQPDRLSFLLHPSRVPVSRPDAIHATSFVFDKFLNLVLQPVTVDYHVLPKKGAPFTRAVKAEHGVAWMRMASGSQGGPVKVIATIDRVSEPRIIQQVASDACNLRIRATQAHKGVLVETEPVKDCSGNPVPDGTVVSFTSVDAKGKTTVDAPVKKGVARTELPITGTAHISVASGVVIGNEISVGGHS